MPELDLPRLLNPEQLAAATSTEGPLLILAGAGSGKTRVLIHRIAHILDRGLARPWEIFAVTFTNKAAGEMRERLHQLVGPSSRDAWIGTFHALSARMLRMEAARLGYASSFTIYDADDSKRLLKTIVDEAGNEGPTKVSLVNAVAHEIDRAKNRGVGPERFADEQSSRDTPHRRLARRVYGRYQEALRRANAMDFGDLLFKAVELLQAHPEARERFAHRFRYVMVDEFQDTNLIQYQLLKELTPHGNLAVVGDDDQAIYRWRGADVSNILEFDKAFPSAKVIRLERNYRSTANILTAANSVIRNNSRRHDKMLRTEASAGAPVALALVGRSEEEASLVAQAIADRVAEDPTDYGDFAVLYRQNAQSRAFEEAFMKARIPYGLFGGTGFYERMEVKDVLAYLRVTANPNSRQDFERVINTPARGIGAKTVERLRRAGAPLELEGAMLLNAPTEALSAAGLSKAAIAKLGKVRKLLEDLRDLSESVSATDVAKEVIERTGYLAHLERTDPTSVEDRIANVSELVSSIAEHEERVAGDDALSDEEEGLGIAGARTPLQAFLDQASLVSPDDRAPDDSRVSLMTLHTAKGLEFPTVFMVGMEERTFPSQRAVDDLDPEALEEERRLCYVGMTRARQELVLTGARFRRIYGREEVRMASRFLGELPDGLVATLGGTPVTPPSPFTTLDSTVEHRGGDRVEYDRDDTGGDPSYRPPPPTAYGGTGELAPGAWVKHNTFGTGRVLNSDGAGGQARLTIEFPDVGTKRVIARFVEPL